MPAPRDHKPWGLYNPRRMIMGYFRADGRLVKRKLASYAELGLDDDGRPYDASDVARDGRTQLLTVRWSAIDAELQAGTSARRAAAAQFSAQFAEFVKSRTAAGYAAQTLRLYERTLRYYLEATGDHPLHVLGGPDKRLRIYPVNQFDRFLAWLQDHRYRRTEDGPLQRLSVASVNVSLQVVIAFLNWCLERDLLDRPPAVRQLRRVHKAPTVPGERAVFALLHRLHDLQLPDTTPSAAERWRYHLDERFIVAELGTGARRAEVFWLRWDQFDLKAGTVDVRVQTRFMVKERREKRVPLLAFAADYFRAVRKGRRKERHLLDDGKGGRAWAHPDTVTHRLREHWAAVGVKDGSKAVHAFRAFYAREAERAGVSVYELQKILGHQRIETTLSYLSDPDGAKARGARTLSGAKTSTRIGNILATSPAKARK